MKGLKSGDKVSYLELRERRMFANGAAGGKRYSWVCRCVCGKEVVRREDLFQEGKSMSCGCKHPSHEALGRESTKWKGRGDLSGQYFGSVRARAEKLGLEFTITIDEAWDLYLGQNGCCALTGQPIVFSTLRARRHGVRQTASLDRIDSTKGYVAGNVWWVDADVNLMKNAFPLARFLEVCRLVTEHAAGLPAQAA